MSATEWMVVVGGVATIAWINWYFFLSQRRATGVVTRGARHEEARASKPKTDLRRQ